MEFMWRIVLRCAMHANISVIECPNAHEHVRFSSVFPDHNYFQLISIYYTMCGIQYNDI